MAIVITHENSVTTHDMCVMISLAYDVSSDTDYDNSWKVLDLVIITHEKFVTTHDECVMTTLLMTIVVILVITTLGNF